MVSVGAALCTHARPRLCLGRSIRHVVSAAPSAAKRSGGSGGGGSAGPQRTELVVMSFNLRTEFQEATDGPDGWSCRRLGVAELLRSRRPALVCCQEATEAMLTFLGKRLAGDGYSWVGVSRSVDHADETAGMLYDRARLELIEHGAEWFGPPGMAKGAAGWDAACPRTMESALFRVRGLGTDAEPALIRAVSTHFDHVGVEARARSAEQLAAACRRWEAEQPVVALVVCGDFNTPKADTPGYACLVASASVGGASLRDVARAAEVRRLGGVRSTIHRFQGAGFKEDRGDGTVEFRNTTSEKREEDGDFIDWFFYRDGSRVRFTPRVFEVVTDVLPNGRFPSDHYPLQATFEVVASAAPASKL